MQRGQQVQDACGGQKACAIIPIGVGNVRSRAFQATSKIVKASSSQICCVAKSGECVVAARRKQIAAHSCSQINQKADRKKNGGRAAPHLQKSVDRKSTRLNSSHVSE